MAKVIPLDVESQLLEKLTNALKSIDKDSININFKSQDILLGIDIQGETIGFTATVDTSPPAGGVVLLGYDSTNNLVRRIAVTSDGKLLVDPSFLQSVNVSVLPRSDNTYDLGSSSLRWRNGYFAGKLSVGNITSALYQLHVYSGVNNGILTESSGDHPRIALRGYDGTNKYTLILQGGYHGRALEIIFPLDGYYVRIAPSVAADSTNTIRNPAKIYWVGKYWDGTTSQNYNFNIIPEILDTTPTGRLRFNFTGVGDILTLHSASGIIAHKNIIPSSDNSINLGSSSYRWANIFIYGVYYTTDQNGVTTKFLSRAATAPNTHFHIFADYTKDPNATDVTVFFGYNSEILRFRFFSLWSGTNTELFRIDGSSLNVSSRTILPFADNTYNLGSSSLRWANTYSYRFHAVADGSFDAVRISIGGTVKGGLVAFNQAGGDIQIRVNETTELGQVDTTYPSWALRVSGYFDDISFFRKPAGGTSFTKIAQVKSSGILPGANNTYDLGSSSYRWRWIYTYRVSVGPEASYPLNVYNNFWWTWTSVIRSYIARKGPGLGILWLGNRRNILYYGLSLDLANWSLDKIWYYDGTNYTDKTAVLTEAGGGSINLLSDTTHAIYLGDGAKFSEIYVYLTTAGAGYSLVIEYSTGTDATTGDTTWATLTVTDGTNNLSQSGWIYWSPPADWAAAPLQIGGTVVDSTSRYWIRIKTSTAPTTIAQTNFINISGLWHSIIYGAVWNRGKFRVDYRGNIYCAGKICLWDGAEGRGLQGTYYIGQAGGQTYTNTHFRPSADNTYDLGTTSYYWRNLYIHHIKFKNQIRDDLITLWGTTYLIGIRSYTLFMQSDQRFQLKTREVNNTNYPEVFQILRSDETVAFGIRYDGVFTTFKGFGTNVLPSSDNTYDLGSSTLRWRNVYVGNLFIHYNTGVAEKIRLHGPTSQFRISLQDGTGRVQFYWNSTVGTSPTYIVSNEPAGKIDFHPPSSTIDSEAAGFTISYAPPGTAGSSITWQRRFALKLDTGEWKFYNTGYLRTILPQADNTYDLGSSSYRWANVYCVNLYYGDAILQNGWKITEKDENGNIINGIRILNEKGEEVFKITNEGLYYKGNKIA